ncbi:MAG TPA: hypothetical protein VLU96_03345 [Gaiellaceae bacterium]|nr:hypothetical protein [Gaiellaceae bacterium]
MKARRSEFARGLQVAHARLEQDDSIEVELTSLDDLVDDRDGVESGAEYLAGVLGSTRHLPETLVVQVVLPLRPRTVERGLAAFSEHCRLMAEVSWRQALTVRRTGLRQLTPSLLAAFVAAAAATGAGALAQDAGSSLLVSFLYAVAGLCLIAAWVIVWMPVEEVLFDWRPAAHVAEAYDLLTRASVEVVERGSRSRLAPRPAGAHRAAARRSTRSSPTRRVRPSAS